MRFVAVADTHGCHRELQLPEGEVFVHAGDVCDRGNREHIDDFFDWIDAIPFAHKIVIWGNHDFDFATGEPLFPESLPAGVIALDHESVQIDDVTIWGTPTSAHKRGEDWESIPSKVDLLLTHRPPFGILDRPRLQPREGSKRLAQAVKRIRPRVHLFGHIHHSYGTVRDQHTTFINASLYNARKKRLVNELCVFDLP